jgi:hypothetical protein
MTPRGVVRRVVVQHACRNSTITVVVGWLVTRRLAMRGERGGGLRNWIVRDKKAWSWSPDGQVLLLGTTFHATYSHFAHSFIHPEPFKCIRKQKTDAQSDFRDDEERFLELRVVG